MWWIIEVYDTLNDSIMVKRLCVIFSCDQAALWMVHSVRLPVRPSVTLVSLCSHHHIIMKFLGGFTNDQGSGDAKGQGQRSKANVTGQNPAQPFPDRKSSLNSYMMMKWCKKPEKKKEKCPIVFQGHPSNLQGHAAKKNDFDPIFSILDCNSSLNSPMAAKCCTKLKVV